VCNICSKPGKIIVDFLTCVAFASKNTNLSLEKNYLEELFKMGNNVRI